MPIPSSSIHIDGNRAWWVKSGFDSDFPASRLSELDRSCETCGGDRVYVDIDRPAPIRCGDCDGTGRHTFEIEVDEPSGCGRCDPYTSHLHGHLYGENCATIECDKHRPTTTLRVHVVEVLPIVGWDYDTGDGNYVILAPRTKRIVGGEPTDITLPPDARPGMWAIQLEVHE